MRNSPEVRANPSLMARVCQRYGNVTYPSKKREKKKPQMAFARRAIGQQAALSHWAHWSQSWMQPRAQVTMAMSPLYVLWCQKPRGSLEGTSLSSSSDSNYVPPLSQYCPHWTDYPSSPPFFQIQINYLHIKVPSLLIRFLCQTWKEAQDMLEALKTHQSSKQWHRTQ